MGEQYYNFIYNAQKQVIFAYVPKVACSNWKCVMRYLEGHGNYLDTQYAHNRKTSGLTYLDQMANKAEILRDTRVKKFACVRDPYSRILSAYLNKIEERLPFLAASETVDPFNRVDPFNLVVGDIEKFRTATLAQSEFPKITFEVFLRWLKAGYSRYTEDEHWAAQSDLLCAAEVRFDIIGRFETLAADARSILEQMGCAIEFPSQKQIKFAPTSAQQKIAQYYTGNCRALVEKIFADDFKYFDYSLQLQSRL